MIDNYSKKIPLNVDFEKVVLDIIQEKGLNVKLKIKEGLKACYDYENKEISVSKGSSVKHLSEIFHELGHAIDDKQSEKKKFTIISTLLFYFFKYSLPLAVVLYIFQTQLYMYNLIIPTFVFITASCFFFTVCLIEEIKASKIGYALIKQYLNLDNKILKKVRICLHNALNSYIVLFIFSILLLVSQIINIVNYPHLLR